MSRRSEGWELLLTPSTFPFLTQRATGTSHFKFSWAFWNFKLKRERETHGQFQARRLLQHQKIPGGSLGLPPPFHSSSWNSEGNSLQSQLGIAFSVYVGGLSRTLWENTLHPQAPVRGFYKASRACALLWVCCQLCMGRKQGVPAPGLEKLIYRKLMMCGAGANPLLPACVFGELPSLPSIPSVEKNPNCLFLLLEVSPPTWNILLSRPVAIEEQ